MTTPGGLKCWGWNDSGRLGDGTTTNRSTPVDVSGLTSGVAAVSSGDRHTCAVTTSGGLKCWGRNFFGLLGDGTTTDRRTPDDVVGLTGGVAAVSAGGSHTCAVITSGGLKCWGWNFFGPLGDGTNKERGTPVDVTGFTGGVAAAVSSGAIHTCAVTTSGGLKCWGYNSSGQLGDGTTIDRFTPVDVTGLTSGVAAVSSGASHTCAVTTSGGLKCWGRNSGGQLGDGTITGRSTPVDVVGLTSGVAAVSAGGNHTCAVTMVGGLKCWGQNSSSELGDSTIEDRSTPVEVVGLTSGVAAVSSGASHTCAVTTSGGLKCWGRNSGGQLGDGTITGRSTPVDVAGLTSGVAAVSSGAGHTCAVTTLGGLTCWGWNSYGQLGDSTATNRTTPVDVTELTSGLAAISAGGNHTCAVTTSGGLKCWGSNFDGQLGDGAPKYRATPADVFGFLPSDVSVEKTASSSTVAAGEQTAFTIMVTNNGPSTSTAIMVVDELPAELVFVTSTPGSPTCSESTGTVTCNLPSLAPGATTTVEVQVVVDPSARGILANVATVAASEPDPDETNNTSTATTTVTAMADLSISKNDSPSPALTGDTLTYTLVITNHGPSSATDVTVLDPLPSSVTYVSSTTQQGNCTGTESISCSLGTLAPNASTTVTLDVTVLETATGTITNTATVSGVEPDPDMGNNTATATSTVNVERDVPLLPGYNLVGIPVTLSEPLLARDLAEALLPDSVSIEDGPVTAVLSWTGAGYLAWLSNNPSANNFELEPGAGYFVRLQTAVPGDELTLVGLPLAVPVTLDLTAGYNLIGVPLATPGTHNALSFAQAIDQYVGGNDVSVGPVLSILGWTGVYDFSLRDNSFVNNFTLEAVRGYFVRMAQAVEGFVP